MQWEWPQWRRTRGNLLQVADSTYVLVEILLESLFQCPHYQLNTKLTIAIAYVPAWHRKIAWILDHCLLQLYSFVVSWHPMPTGICEQDNNRQVITETVYCMLTPYWLSIRETGVYGYLCIIMFDKITRTQFCWTFCSPLLSQTAGHWSACYSQCTGSVWEELVSSKYWSRIHSYALFVYEKTVKSNINNISGITYSTVCILAHNCRRMNLYT